MPHLHDPPGSGGPDHHHGQPVDPDVDLHLPEQRQEWRRRWVLPVISLGGMVGASARYGLELAWPAAADGFPWATLVTNVSGCLLIGLLMVYVVEAGAGHPLVRPFLGVGVLGGFTTFSTYAVDAHRLLRASEPITATAYLTGTVAAALTAVVLGVALGRRVTRSRARAAA